MGISNIQDAILKNLFHSFSQSTISVCGYMVSTKYFPIPIESAISSVTFKLNHSLTSNYILRFLSGLVRPFTPQCSRQVFVGTIL